MDFLERNHKAFALVAVLSFTGLWQSCKPTPRADLIIKNGRVYTFAWPDPDRNGNPSPGAPFKNQRWTPEASAIAIKDSTIIFIGKDENAEKYAAGETKIIDVKGATVLPGLIDAHTHVEALGEKLELLDLTDVPDEQTAVELIAQYAQSLPKGTWIVGRGWDEGAWADRYPDKTLISRRVPDHPVLMNGLHTFASWCNQMALDMAEITSQTPSPAGGEIVKDKSGVPVGLFLNKATEVINAALPEPDQAQLMLRIQAGLQEMAQSGFTAVHNAGGDSELFQALERLALANKLPIRVYAMLGAREEKLLQKWMVKGPKSYPGKMLEIRSVKAFYDGALGSRGARLLQEYSDLPGHFGVSASEYGFNPELLAGMAEAGFQLAIHAIGDAANRETLDFLEPLVNAPGGNLLRHRIEHAQVIHPDDIARFGKLGIIASMQPPHAAEDKTWAEDRLGAGRIRGAYAWRSLRSTQALVIFGSDLVGSDHNIFYGLHAAMTRRGKELEPQQGWYIEEAFSPEEALRAYTKWAAYGSFIENQTGTLEEGKWADITVMNIDPLEVGRTDAAKLFDGEILLTIVGGRLVYQSSEF